jgi:amidase
LRNPNLNVLSEDWLIDVTIDEIQTKFNNHELTSYELVLMYLSRIAKYDKLINSVLEVNPDCLTIAHALDEERKISGPRSIVHGIPVILKDNIDTGDKMHTSAGSLALKDSYALKDSDVARRLREAGAIILGKANMTEWANFMTYNMPNGYSSRGGQVLNPYGSKIDVGGSSSGSAAAVSANLVCVSVGTETSGSILSPASQNSCVGIKPTVGLIGTKGIIPISHSQDTAGPIARNVKDCVYLLNALANNNFDYTAYLEEDIKGYRFGVCREGLNAEKLKIFDSALKSLASLGGIIKDTIIPTAKEKWNINVLLYEFKNGLNYYLSPKTLADIIAFNNQHKDKALQYGQSILLEAEKTSGNLTESEYLTSLESDLYLSRTSGIDKIINEAEFDCLVFPNNFGAAIPAKAGYPSITVPCGYTKANEPVGITFTGKAFSEPTLIKIAYAFEQATKIRKPPQL